MRSSVRVESDLLPIYFLFFLSYLTASRFRALIARINHGTSFLTVQFVGITGTLTCVSELVEPMSYCPKEDTTRTRWIGMCKKSCEPCPVKLVV